MIITVRSDSVTLDSGQKSTRKYKQTGVLTRPGCTEHSVQPGVVLPCEIERGCAFKISFYLSILNIDTGADFI